MEVMVMKLWIGVLLLIIGGVLALFGYAPIDSTLATSLPLIAAGGIAIACGTTIVLLASAKSGENDVDRDQLIRA
jgi:hypothetical protein